MNELSLWRRGIRRVRVSAKLEPETKLPERLVVPLEPADSTYGHRLRVEAGETVRRNQLIALGSGLAPNLHSPAAGKVESVDARILRRDGSYTRGVVITVSGNEAVEPDPVATPAALPAEEILERISKAGVAMRGQRALSLAAVITAAQQPSAFLAATGSPVKRSVSHLVVRFADADPSLASVSAAAAVANGKPEDFMLGLKLLTRTSGTSRVTLVLHARQKLPEIERLADELELGLVRVAADRYPDLSAPLIAAKVTGAEPAVGLAPIHASGILVVDVDTVLDVLAAVRDGLPAVHPFVTVTTSMGVQVVRPAIGTPLRALVGAGARAEARKIVLGGPMAGTAVPDFDYPITKETDGVWVLATKDLRRSENLPCMGCGACVRACPMRLVPSLLSRAAEFDQLETALALDVFHCIDCGVCGYVCPAQRSMVQLITSAKTALASQGRH